MCQPSVLDVSTDGPYLPASKAEADGGGQGGPPSILVPVILFMALNRWNTFFAEDVGLTLVPIPMLLGFFTYKPASAGAVCFFAHHHDERRLKLSAYPF